MAIPERFIKTTRNGRTVYFAGQPINLSALSVHTQLDNSYLSRVFSLEREPSLSHTIKLATALGMGLQEFVDHLKRAA